MLDIELALVVKLMLNSLQPDANGNTIMPESEVSENSLRFLKDESGMAVLAGEGDSERYFGRVMLDGGIYYADDNAPDNVKAAMEAHAAEKWKVEHEGTNRLLPDRSVTLVRRDAYGYTVPDMLPLNSDKALELFDGGHPVYLL